METVQPPFIQLIRDGQIDELLRLFEVQLPTRELFLDHMGSHLQEFIRLTAQYGYIKVLQCCADYYDVEVKISHSYGLDAIAEAASQGHDHIIEWLLQSWIVEEIQIEGRVHSAKKDVPKGWLCPSLHRAVYGRHLSTVRLLIQKGRADVNAIDENKTKPIDWIAVSVDKYDSRHTSWYEDIIDVLVTADARVTDTNPFTNTTLLCDAVNRNNCQATKILISGGADVFAPIDKTGRTVLHLAAKAGFCETLHVMMEHEKLSKFLPREFDITDKNGWTPLHAAVMGRHLSCIRMLINKGLSLVAETTEGTTVMQAIFKHVAQPIAFLTEILDEQISVSDNFSHIVALNFQVLAPDNNLEMSVVSALINALPNFEQRTILQHPLLETYIQQQYSRTIGLNLFVLAAHIVFSVLLSWHVSCVESLDFPCMLVTMITLSIPAEVMFAENIARGKINGLTFVIHVFLWLVLLVSFISTDYSKSVCGSPVTLHIMAIMILLSWVNTMMILGRFPLIGEWAFMFFTVLCNVTKVFFGFACPIIGFAVCFSVLFSETDEFNTVWKSLAKTVVMMTGEYDYSDLFPSTVSVSSGKDNNSLPIIRIIVFLTFVMLTSLALMNLMVALAVNDIQVLLKEGRTRRLLKQVECTFLTGHYCTFLICTFERTMKLNVRSSSWIPWRDIPADVKEALYNIAVKNLNRDNEPSMAPICNNTEDSLAEMKVLQQELINQVQILNTRILKMLEKREQDHETQPRS